MWSATPLPGEETPGAAGTEARHRAGRLLAPADWALMLGLTALGLALRLRCYSGFGLGDDFIFRNEVNILLKNKAVVPDNQAYRFTWWLPTAFTCRLFGLTHLGLILPFIVTATLGLALVYALGKSLYGRAGAIAATLLLVVHPLDLTWSTMMTNDLMLSFFIGATILLALRALAHEDAMTRERYWVGAAVSFWLAYHSKVSGLIALPIVAVVCLVHRSRLDRHALAFVVAAVVLFLGSALVLYVFTGDPLFNVHSELMFQGLQGPGALGRRVTPGIFWYFPRLLFARDEVGDLVNSVYPHVLLGLVLLAPLLRLRTSGLVIAWLLLAFAGLQLNVQRVEGVWVSGFRNIRHAHVVVYPLVLALAGFVASLRAKRPRLCDAAFAVLLAFSAWQAVATSSKTRQAFGDRWHACRFLEGLARKPAHLDQGLRFYCETLDPTPPLEILELPPNPDQWQQQIQLIRSGYLVTGGGREPYYGCPHCIPSAAAVPRARFRLLTEFDPDVPPASWRAEPLRVWEAIETPGAAGTSAPQ